MISGRSTWPHPTQLGGVKVQFQRFGGSPQLWIPKTPSGLRMQSFTLFVRSLSFPR